ncbi:GNAT family N-acetyltransferase [Paenibacillus sp. sptzw28]|uniref:GNAT family N-acetyltransferase n=1 Tax=Paenibacillus sp. sptzw28 TaxID=715179 RepID=UPI001C6EC3A8|nr:GNAT family N-acetyltransferase [Paenibacillus sp. sptzw28]QYR21299.1 GNAT family N-acetyltransferase [Paenibacillus sp. sptzw28]
MITKPCKIDEIQHLIEEYIQTLSSPFDSFLEEHILKSAFYIVLNEEMEVGYYAVRDDELLTQFYIRRSAQKHAQAIFTQVLDKHDLNLLFVPTCDELFISLALDKDITIRKQAYFFQDSQEIIPADDSLSDVIFRLGGVDDLKDIERVCSRDFPGDYDKLIEKGELFTYYRGAALLGIGVFEKSSLLPGFASIGMCTDEAVRRQGIGRSIILELMKWCYEHNLTPICGCGYDNHASKRTLESAGMVTRTRLLRIEIQ